MWHKNVYTPPVRLGNWYEDVVLEEETIKDFLHKKSQNELLMQKTAFVKEKLLQPVELSVVSDGYVRFGNTVQIKNLGDPSRIYFGKPRADCVLSANCDTDLVFNGGLLVPPCKVTGSRQTSPCLQNSFIITSGNESDDGQMLHYNQTFYLRIPDQIGGHLYLQSDRFDFSKCSQRARHQQVFLSDQTMYLAKWRVLYFNQLLRLEHDYHPVCANKIVIINHVYTNQNLNVEDTSRLLSTEYNADYEITAHTLLDEHKAEKEQNLWLITTREPEGIALPPRCLKTPPSPVVPCIEETIPAVKEAETKPAGICSLTISEEERQGMVHDLQNEESRLHSQYIDEHTKDPRYRKKVEFADPNNKEDLPCSNCNISNNSSNNHNKDAVAPTTTPAEASKM
ncbi:cilia- and flagella-associated protein 161-like [Octopus sinensis]|uniref:Cilia- and flagella-associated protein 161-like n=1 Tax=Octopus sinensis TaxID=2607531 RepID=A0A6P7TKU0_9MOLL|nr:cilia- and flagella-associated protein 161-like [Octopus sinensis]